MGERVKLPGELAASASDLVMPTRVALQLYKFRVTSVT